VVEKRTRIPGDDVWLMVRRSLGETPETKYYLSNAPAGVDRGRMAEVASERWRVENAIKETKGQTGLDESEGRFVFDRARGTARSPFSQGGHTGAVHTLAVIG